MEFCTSGGKLSSFFESFVHCSPSRLANKNMIFGRKRQTLSREEKKWKVLEKMLHALNIFLGVPFAVTVHVKAEAKFQFNFQKCLDRALYIQDFHLLTDARWKRFRRKKGRNCDSEWDLPPILHSNFKVGICGWIWRWICKKSPETFSSLCQVKG